MSTKIEWCRNADGTQGTTWNPLVGCSRISPGCKHCYAERQAQRLVNMGTYPVEVANNWKWTGKVAKFPAKLGKPLHWRKPRRIFVGSMGDLFHEQVDFKYIAAIFGVMAATPQHTYQLLTKRPERMLEFFRWIEELALSPAMDALFKADPLDWRIWQCLYGAALQYGASPLQPRRERQWPLRNAWLGTTAEDQERANQRIPALIECPAALRFVSCEPLLGEVDLDSIDFGEYCASSLVNRRLGLVIAGGESGPGARPMHPNWARSLRDQCAEADVPFFFKQHGEWASPLAAFGNGRGLQYPDWWNFNKEPREHNWGDGNISYRVGKKRAGRALDGQLWDQTPEVDQ